MSKEEIAELSCSFCGKNQREVRKLIAGPTVYIGDECIGLCNDIISDEIDREECAAALRAKLPARVRTFIASLLERGVPAVRILSRHRAAGEPLDERVLVWLPRDLVADWRDLHDILVRATSEESELGEDGPLEAEDVPGWVSPITERLAEALEVVGVVSRSLEKPGLEEVLRQLRPSVDVAVERLREAREMLMAGPPRGPEETP
jgi:hypothetical protein